MEYDIHPDQTDILTALAEQVPAFNPEPFDAMPCGCVDYHMADCPTLDRHRDDIEPDEDGVEGDSYYTTGWSS